MEPEKAFQLLRTGNRRFVDGTPVKPNFDPELQSRLVSEGQNPFAAVLACSDSRVPVEMLFDCGMGDLFVMRVAGNVVGPTMVGTIQYALEVLKVSLLVVLGHEECGAVTAAMAGSALHGPLGELIEMVETGDCVDLPCAIEQNVRAGIGAIRDNLPTICQREQTGDLKVTGGVFSIVSGEIRWLSEK